MISNHPFIVKNAAVGAVIKCNDPAAFFFVGNNEYSGAKRPSVHQKHGIFLFTRPFALR
jgi:hypothetical protein